MISNESITRIMAKYPTKVPIIITMEDDNVHKLLVDVDSRFDCVIHHVRTKKTLSSRQALFFFVNDRIVTGQDTIESLKKRAGNDYILVFCKTENTFG